MSKAMIAPILGTMPVMWRTSPRILERQVMRCERDGELPSVIGGDR